MHAKLEEVRAVPEGELWLEADYFDEFRCKGGACRGSCCEGWEIAMSMKDYFKLIGMDCSPEMHHRLECAFRTPEEPSPERYRLISPNWMGMCPMHGGDGLCMLQRECGAEALPEICRVYPRSLKEVAGRRKACCSNSCEAVVELLMRREPVGFRTAALSAAPECVTSPEWNVARICRACIERLQDREVPLNRRVAAVCGLLGGATPAVDPGRAEEGLRALMGALSEMQGVFGSLRHFGERALERYGADGARAIRNYREDAAAMEARFPDWEAWFENMLVNHFFYEDVPCVDARLKPEDACAGICAVYAAMRVVSAAYTAAAPAREDLADALAGIFRMIEHSAFYYNARVLIQRPESMLAL